MIEAKAPETPFGPDQVLFELVDFLGTDDTTTLRARQHKRPDRAYVGALLGKAAAITRQVPAALAAVALPMKIHKDGPCTP